MVMALILVSTILMGYAIPKIALNADFSTYLRQDDPIVQRYNYVGEEYESRSLGLVLLEADDIFNREKLELIRDLTEAYEGLEGIAYVTSLTNVLDFKKTEWGLEVGKLIPSGTIPENGEELKRLKDYVLSKEMYVKDLVSEDGKSTVIAIRLKHGIYEFGVAKKVRNVTEGIAPPSEDIAYAGLPFLIFNTTLLIIETMERLGPLMIFLILAVLFLGFRKAGGIFVPLLVVVFSVLWTVGLMAWFGISLNMMTGIMPVILLAMGSADGIHIMRRYYEKKQLGRGPVDAIRETFSELSRPIIITTFTTMIGFLSLLISNFSVIQQFGLVTSLGVFIALLVTFLFIPVLITFAKPKDEKQGPPPSPRKLRFMERWAELVYKGRVAILLLSGLVVIASALLIPQIKKDVDFSLCLKKGSKAHRAEMLLRRDFGGTIPVQALVKGDIKDPATLKAMRFLERYLETVPSVGEVQSMAKVISEMNEVMNDRYIVPETREGVANLWFLIEGEEIIEQMVREDSSEGLIQAKLDTWESETISKSMNSINHFIDAIPKKVFIVDLNKVPAKVREALIEIRGERIASNLMRDMASKQIEADGDRLKTIVKTTLLAKGLDRNGYHQVRNRVVNYLLSEDAEVETVSEGAAANIAEELAKEIRGNGGIRLERIMAIAGSKLIQPGGEEMKELALSLEVVIREAVGEAKVADAFQRIKRLLPPGAEEIRDLFRNLKGDLWAMNEDLMALGMNAYKNLWSAPEPSDIKVVPISLESAGLASVLKRMEEELIPSQMYSLFSAFVLIFIVMAFIFRSATIGLIGVTPIGLTILINFAAMSLLRIGLDSFTAMVASIALGLGIDFNVHFISCFKREFSHMGDELKALKNTFSTTGVAILINALTIGLGFAVLLLAGGQHVRRFGGLVALTVTLSALFSFTVMPAIIMLLKPKFMKKEKEI
jgi:predicted RND superfamily exporter protein